MNIQENISMISFSIVFFLPFTFLLLRSLSAVSSSFFLSFFHSYPTLSRSLLIQSLIAISVYLASIYPTLSGHLLSASFSSPNCLHDQPIYSHQFLLRTFLHTNLHPHLIHFLLSALLTPTIILTRLFFANLDLVLFLC